MDRIHKCTRSKGGYNRVGKCKVKVIKQSNNEGFLREMDGYIIRSGSGVNFESNEVAGFTIEVNKYVVFMNKLI
eukprot:12071795-Ditylum_brightwellii.AAC.2